MTRAIAARLIGALPVLFLVTLLIFTLLRLAPGDAADLLVPDDASEADIAAARARWGLDRPILEQYLAFLGNIVRLDFGVSYRYGEDVFTLIAMRLPATLELSIVSLLMGSLMAVPLGILAALRRGKFLDGVVSVIAIAGVSAPTFWMAILMVLFLSAELNLFPSSGRLPFGSGLEQVTGFLIVDSILQGRLDLLRMVLSFMFLPAFTLALNMMGIIARITRSSVIDVGQEEFVTTAVSKGLPRQRIVRRHLLPNAMIPITTVIGLELGTLISGSIIVEVVFSWPGLGTLLYQAISTRDIPLVTGVVVIYTALFILINVLIDITYFLIDPRVRAAQAG